jgi:fatty acid desaturase
MNTPSPIHARDPQVTVTARGLLIAWDTLCTLAIVCASVALYFAIGLWAIVLVPAYLLGAISFALFAEGNDERT